MNNKQRYLCSALILLLLIAGCTEKDTTSFNPINSGPAGRLVDYGGCKDFKGAEALDGAPPDKDCIEYMYNGERVLLLKHINAGFNCCPVEILADISIEGNIITIEESEAESACDCLCLFDLDYEIKNLQPGEYTIRIIEPYTTGDDEKLEFTVDLSSSPSGSYCVDRKHYPWDVGNTETEPAGVLTGYSGCKSTYTQYEHCIEYQYYWDGRLLLKHINAFFNCCLHDIDGNVTIEDQIITMEEREIGGLCFCICPYDLDYEILDLDPGIYTIRALTGYQYRNAAKLEFTVNLFTSPSGIHCANDR